LLGACFSIILMEKLSPGKAKGLEKGHTMK
jgi:hypothetical protein